MRLHRACLTGVLAAARAGGKALRGSTGVWSDVEAAYDYWARLIAARLALFRDRDEFEPKATAP